MKKMAVLTIALYFALGVVAANAAYTVYFGFDDTLDFSLMQGFGFDVVGANVNDLTLDVGYQAETVDVGVNSYRGSVPDEYSPDLGLPWDVYKTTSPNGVTGYDFSGSTPLIPGIALSLEGDSFFSLDNFLLACDSDPDGKYPKSFFVKQEPLGELGMSYTSTVPIPGSVLLLGSGLLGLMGIGRRRMRKS